MILVTGGTGLVGSHLLMALADSGEKVRALFRDQARVNAVERLFAQYGKADAFRNIEWTAADLNDIPALEPAFQGIEQIYHCAGFISFDPADEELLRKVNIEGTANIVNCCLAFGIKKLCFVSSIAALGDLAVNETVFSEQTEWNPEKFHSDYAISKYGAEMEVWRGQQEGLQVVIVNPGVILGPFATTTAWQQGSGRIFAEIKKGLPWYTNGTTGFVGVWDVVRAMILLMDAPVSGERFILVSENLSFENLSKMIAHALAVSAPKREAKRWMTMLAARFDGIRALFLGRRKLSLATARSLHTQEYYDNGKLQTVLDFEFEPVTTAIHRTVPFFRA